MDNLIKFKIFSLKVSIRDFLHLDLWLILFTQKSISKYNDIRLLLITDYSRIYKTKFINNTKNNIER